ncbi:MAG: SGNH/GDSL hydrolase family protein [Planctomycetaceae bacterium]
MTETSPAEPQETAAATRRSLRRRLLFIAILLVALEAAGWLGDYIFNDRRRLLSALTMMRLNTQPIPALSNTSDDRELVLRDPADGPGTDEPYRIGGVEIAGAGPWLGTQDVVPDDVVRDGEHRVFIVGGSAAFGFPYRYADSLSGLVEPMLGQGIDGERVRIFNAAQIGWTSGELAPVVDQAVRFYKPAAVVLFVGNNEWFHWQPLLKPSPDQPPSDEAPAREELSQTSINVLRTLAHSRALAAIEYGLVQWMVSRRRARQDEARRSRTRDSFESHHELTGSDYAVEMPLAPERYDPSGWLTVRQKYLDTFQTNLSRMVATARDADVPVVLLTVPFNPRLSPAWKHRQPHSFVPEHRRQVTAAIAEASQAVKQGRFEEGLATVTAALELDPHPTILHYLQAQCLEGLERHQQAELVYAESRERTIGNLGSRLSTNRIIREVAEAAGVPVIDVQALFQQYGARRQRYYNVDLIHDDCHPTPLGHQLIAEALAPLLRSAITDSEMP